MRTRSNPSIKKQLYNRISYLGTVSKADLLKDFSLTSSSMTRLLEEMLAQGTILASGLGNSTGGRKPILFQTNPSYRYVFGLEISRIYSTLGLYDMHLNALSVVRLKMDKGMTPERFVDHVTKEAKAFLLTHKLSVQDVLGIGIGAVGPLDQKNGVILKPEFFPSNSWRNVPICAMIEDTLQIPAKLDNGANTALIGEHWALKDESIQHVLYIHAGINIRSAMISEGQVLRGAVDTEGAVGQMIIQTNGLRLRNQGNYGALEAYVSILALEDRIRTQLKMGRSSLLSGLPPEDISFAALIDALSEGDPLVEEQFTETAAYLGIGLANLINALHPEYVILGGALVNAHPLVYNTALEIAKKNTYHYPEYSPVFSQGMLKDEAVATGAAILLLHEWEG
ncbi:ROK family protein [Paenibacillus albidus]|uniref:ROK family protein n=1 Tax=Paenibacillus albidus TaxID=2041023 RepID=UPI001BE9A3EF|nr:ROK family protein [Paenibacillus albidus]MBT2290960.1 ROK family protein [Paenibacillus albidus]